MEYQIVAGITVGQLTDDVNAAVEEGWEPTGGVCYGVCDVSEGDEPMSEVKPVLFQAMIRKQRPNRESPYFGE